MNARPAAILRRSGAIRSLAALSGLAAVAPAALRAQALPVVRFGVIGAELDAQLFYGVDLGTFQKHGIDVQLQRYANGNAIAAGLASGAVDVGHVEIVTMISARAHEFPLVYVFPGLVSSDVNPAFGVLVKGDSPIRQAKDFNGTTVGVALLNTISQLPFQVWVDNNGGSSKSIKFVEVPLPAMVAAVSNGTVAATTPPEPFLTFGAQAGDRVILMQHGTMARSFILNGWAVSREWLLKNRAIVPSIVAALHEVSTWANTAPPAAVAILSKYTSIPAPVIAQTRRPRFAESFSSAELQPTIDAAARYGIIKKPFPARDLVVS